MQRQPALPVRLIRSFAGMGRDQRLAVAGAVGLFVSLFLPWYEETRSFAIDVKGKAQGATVHQTHTAISVFTFVEAAELLTAGAVLFLLFARAEGRAFHLPGGDGTMVTAGGAWALLLVVWRFFDKPDFGANSTAGLHWGILGPLAAASVLLYAGQRIRIAHRPEPPLPGEPDYARAGERDYGPPPDAAPPPRRARRPTPPDEAYTQVAPTRVVEPRTEVAERRTEVAEPRTEVARRRRAPAPPGADPAPPRNAPAAPRNDPAAPRNDPAPGRADPAAPRTDPAPPRNDPAAPRTGPAPARADPAPPRTDPAPPRDDPAAPRTDPASPRRRRQYFDEIPEPDEPPTSPDHLQHRPPPPPAQDQLRMPWDDEE